MDDSDVLPPPTPILSSRGGTSIKSFKFRERMTSSSPPSIGGDSTRRKAFSFLTRRPKNVNRDQPTLNSLVLAEKLLDAQPRESSENVDPGLRSKLPSSPLPPTTSPPPTKQGSQSIFRKLTTKLTPNKRRSVAIPSTTAWASQEARNAALRERGLLPQLPLSVQEAQQDSRIAVVVAEPTSTTTLERRESTAASRVKEEWEAKNRERLAGFRFGGASPVQESFPTTSSSPLEPPKEVDTPLPSPNPTDPPPEFIVNNANVELSSKPTPRAPPPTLNLKHGLLPHHLSPPLMQAWSDSSPPDLDDDEALDPCFLLPLPPSPAPDSDSTNKFSSLISAFSADTGLTPISPAFRDGDVTLTPKPQSHPHVPAVVPPPPLATSTSESSVLSEVPSLVSDTSQASLNSPSFSSPPAPAAVGRMRNVPLASTVRNSTVEPLAIDQHHAISVIVESPVDDDEGAGAGVVVLDNAVPVVVEEKAAQSNPTPNPTSNSIPTSAAVAPTPSPAPLQQQHPQRRKTDPGAASSANGKPDRRKSLNVFKNLSLRRPKAPPPSLPLNSSSPSTTADPTRTSRTARTKARSALGVPAGFDASLLPPSPTLSAGFAAQQGNGRVQQQGQGKEGGGMMQNRMSLNPTMHNAETILEEMNKIGDEESRRMTEVAFM